MTAETNGASDPTVQQNGVPTRAVEFCRWWIDNVGPITITHLHPDLRDLMAPTKKEQREPTEAEKATVYIEYGNTRTFPHRRERERGEVWLGHNAAGFNTYFQPCTIRELVKGEKPNSKPKKDKIEYVACVWADIDPPAGCADLDAWRRAQVEALENHPTLPPPHIVSNSGNGVQAIWLLDEPFVINGEQSRWQEFECTTRAIIALFADGDDGTWNADRLLRMPFTTNYPDAKKREKGRVPCQSGILLWRVDRPRVSIGALPKQGEHSAARRGSRGIGARTATVKVPADLMVDLSGKEFAPHHQPLLDDLASWDCVLGDRLPNPEQVTLEDGRVFDNAGGWWHAFVDVDLPPYEEIERISGQGLDALIEGDRTGHWSTSTDNNAEACSFAFSAIKAGIRPAHVAALLTHEQFAISRHCRDAGGHDKIVRAARRCVGQAIALVEQKRPSVRVPQAGHDDAAFAREMGPILAANGFYLRGGQMAVVEGQRLSVLKKHEATTLVQDCAHFWGYDEGAAGKMRDWRLSTSAVEILLASPFAKSCLPVVDLVTDVPLVNADGTCTTGYHDGVIAFGDAPPVIGLDEAQRRLAELFRDFNTKTPHDRARMYAALISPAMQWSRLLRGARFPAFLAEADDSQAGKGYFVRMLLAVYQVKKPTVVTQRDRGVGSIEEQISAGFLTGSPLIYFDNWRGALDSPGLESLMTEDSFMCRVPHGTPTSVDTRMTSLGFTTNGMSPPPDLVNRFNPFRLRKQPATYRFKEFKEGDLNLHIAADPGYYLAAVYAVLREWLKRGKPKAADAGGHDMREWARAVRWICTELLGLADPMVGLVEIKARMTSPGGSWLRTACNIVVRKGRVGIPMTATDLVQLFDGEDIEMPGWRDGDDTDDDAVMLRLKKSMGTRLAKCFAGVDAVDGVQRVEIDGRPVERTVKPKPGDPTKAIKTLTVLGDGGKM